jgi:hypothetical protein
LGFLVRSPYDWGWCTQFPVDRARDPTISSSDVRSSGVIACALLQVSRSSRLLNMQFFFFIFEIVVGIVEYRFFLAGTALFPVELEIWLVLFRLAIPTFVFVPDPTCI